MWTSSSELAFFNLKDELYSDRVLVPYEESLPLVLAIDPFRTGTGAVISHLQNEKEMPVHQDCLHHQNGIILNSIRKLLASFLVLQISTIICVVEASN